MNLLIKQFLLLLTICLTAVGFAGDMIDTTLEGTFTNDLVKLTTQPHRLAGRSDGSRVASEYVEKRLRTMGVDEVYLQEFPVVQTRTIECRLVCDEGEFPILAVRPNVLQASVTPKEGISGTTIYAGNGDTSNYCDESPKDKIVVLNFDCDKNWINAFAFGAKAVLFVGTGDETIRPLHHVNMPVNMPRFYISDELAEKLQLKRKSQKITIFASATYEELEACNVIGVIRGTNPIFNPGRPKEREAIVLAAPLDSYSEIPELAPGARDAGNIASLLHIASYLVNNRPRRDVIVAFLDGQSHNNYGARVFYGAFYRRIGVKKVATYTIDQKAEMLKEEKSYYEQVLKVLEQKEIFSTESARMSEYSSAVRILRDESARMSNEISLKLAALRERLVTLQKTKIPENLAEIEKLRPSGSELGAIDYLQVEELTWNSLLRVANEQCKLDEAFIQRLARKLVTDQNAKRRDKKAQLFTERIKLNYTQLVKQATDLCQRRINEITVTLKRNEQSLRIYSSVGPQTNNIVLHISINLSDTRPVWSFVHGDDTAPYVDDPEHLYSEIFKSIRQTANRLKEQLPNFDIRPLSDVYQSRLFAPAKFGDSSAIAAMFKRYNLSMVTVLDSFSRHGLPCDRLEKLISKNMFIQANEAKILIKNLADDAGLSRQYSALVHVLYDEPSWSANRPAGHMVRRLDTGDMMRTAAVGNAIVAAFPVYSSRLAESAWSDAAIERVPPGFIWELVAKTRADGYFELPPYARPSDVRWVTWRHFSALFEPPDTTSTDPFVIASSRGLINMCTVNSSFAGSASPETPVGIARVRSKTVVGYGFERLTPTIVTRATSTARFRDDQQFICEFENILGLYAPLDATGAKFFNPYGIALLDNKSTKQEYHGKGILLDDPFAHPVTVMQTTHDIYALNEYRINLLRKNQIGVESLEKLHARAHDIAVQAEQATNNLDKFLGTLEASSAFSRRIYKPLVGVMNDLVTAVVFLLLLTLPFAYALERLLIGTPDIHKRIAWFALFFLMTFGILYTVNPAFKLAATPIIIFLAFAIVLLSSAVIFIMVRKLNTEVKKMRGLSASTHTVDVSRVSAMAAAVQLGISTMRRRPIRTLLTCLTVALLTFTILTFASFGNTWGNRRSYIGPLDNPPARIFVRHPLWNNIPHNVYQTLRGFLTGKADVVPLYWLAPLASETAFAQMQENKSLLMLVSSDDLSNVVAVAGAVGLDLRDVTRLPRLKTCLDENANLELLESDCILLPKIVSHTLGLTPQDIGKRKILFLGTELTYAGDLKEEFGYYSNIDGTSILPVDYKATMGAEGVQGGQTLSENIPTTFMTFNANMVVGVSAVAARKLGARIRAITIYPDNQDIAPEIAEDVAIITGLPVSVGSHGAVYRLLFSTLIKASGFNDLFIPVLLGGLIVFGTLLGSVTDREREIYTLSSLGLAPVHVAGLFFAEASIYAIIGGMGGYLLGQASVKILSILTRFGLFSVPALNFSSMNAIATIFLVMLIVMLSAVYPAKKASKSANPGIQRTWRLPNPVGDVYDIAFPFTVSEYDLTGIASYLEEHFNNCRDVAVGVFATINCEIFKQQQIGMLGMSATVALSPFDLGIEQKFVLISQPSEIEGIDEVRILLKRTSGTYADWRRANRVFIHNLRKQFLIWRTLNSNIMEHYRECTLKRLDSLPVRSKSSILEEFAIQK